MVEALRPQNPGDLQTREKRTLGRFRHLGLMYYKDLDAYYCLACGIVYNVKCANCGATSTNRMHVATENRDDVFIVERPFTPIKSDGLYWTTAQCRKCDFRFRTIVR